jgi:hypothetical protein
MDRSDTGLTAEDHAYRHAAEAYFGEKGALARTTFEAKLAEVFHSFEDHWRDFFAPSDPIRLEEYLATPFEVRTAQFERFKRECRAWEVSFRHCTKAHAGRRAPPANGASDWSDLKRRLDEQRDRAEQVREFYDNLDSLLDRERQARRSHPIELFQHLRALELATDAPLEEVKKQYKKLARVHHPDRRGDSLKMSRINEAYRAIMIHYKVAVAGS